MLKGKFIVLGVTGGIAAYKMPNLARMLIKAGADVQVIMTKNAQNFITPFTFETLTKNKCLTDTFDRNFTYSVEHVSVAKRADLVMIAPATANVIGKIASGIADDMLTTTVMACTCKKIIAPAMNHNMYHNEIVEDNIKKLKAYGYEFIGPDTGMLANGDMGDGRLVSEEVLFERILTELSHTKDLLGKRVLITAGATKEAIDPVRYITNHSSGKMGLALAKSATMRGADVTVIKGETKVKFPDCVEVVHVSSADDMYKAVMERLDFDIYVSAAAVADYTPKTTAKDKIKKSDTDMSIELIKTQDILSAVSEHRKDGQFICGFSMETENVLENSRQKLRKKNLDMIVCNNLNDEGAGFGMDTNIVTVITKDKEIPLPKMSKSEVADKIFDYILEEFR
ncbi:MAG: bifunctional phosphopantothenoylcysteine decarboxylase/phosphopantothenate--cysteine ligase CoaBC [Clostridia bacterium]|nr:bifunctional phosphopantothenoylcysteine decarboxylase/phosphopantothenate--cysteine ligase CoaBC [Clostridia bacterium]